MRTQTRARLRLHRPRRSFAAGRVLPGRDPKPCSADHHVGPFLIRHDMEGWLGKTWYDCAHCRSSLCGKPRKVA